MKILLLDCLKGKRVLINYNMAKIKLPGGIRLTDAVQRIEEIDIPKGELVLVRPVNSVRGVVLGIFEALERFPESKTLTLQPAYNLYKTVSLGGVTLPMMDYICMCGKLGLARYDINSINRYYRIYVGQDESVKALESWPGFEAHAEWVAKLRKPY